MKYLILLVLLTVVGCGGSGGGGSISANAFTGSWSGTWGASGSAMPPPGDAGTLSLHIAADGSVTGTCFNAGKNVTVNVTGTNNVGKLSLTFDYPSDPDWLAYGTLKISGGHLKGNLFVDSEEYNRTVFTYYTAVDLSH